MTRKLIIVGNGLGMAVDPEHFLLSRALDKIWDLEGILDDKEKELIGRCLGHEGAPVGEDELDILQLAVSYCKELNKIGNEGEHWLTEYGQEFPKTTSKYIHKVATELHNFDGELPENFENKLIAFLRKTKSHIATLNYDKLLYNSFIDKNIVSARYDKTILIDGMTDHGFSADRLERLYSNNFGYYLHLHGSPLFINGKKGCLKLKRNELTLDYPRVGEHIVLTHVKHKPNIIAASNVLSTYWDYLRFALSETEEVILFGYSGYDLHLNELLRPYLKDIPVRIIEWSGNYNPETPREHFWTGRLGREININVISLDKITDFDDWD